MKSYHYRSIRLTQSLAELNMLGTDGYRVVVTHVLSDGAIGLLLEKETGNATP